MNDFIEMVIKRIPVMSATFLFAQSIDSLNSGCTSIEAVTMVIFRLDKLNQDEWNCKMNSVDGEIDKKFQGAWVGVSIGD